MVFFTPYFLPPQPYAHAMHGCTNSLDAGEPVENSQQAMEENTVVDSYQECSECLWGRIGVSCECEKDKPDTE